MYPRLIGCVAVIFFGLTIASSAQAQGLVSRYVAGQDYHEVSQPGPERADGDIRIAEFFLYSCPHCYHFEHELNDWREQHPDVAFSRVPVLFSQASQPYARLYYSEVKLGVADRLHDAIFDAIHQQGRPLATEAAMRQFMVAHGVDGERFESAYESQAVKAKVQKVVARMQRYQVTAVPSISVAGRYWVSGRSAGSNERMLKIVDYLIEQVRNDASSTQGTD